MAGKEPAEELKGRGTDHQGIGRRNALQAGGEVGGLTQRQLFLPGTAPYLPHHDEPGMDPQAHGQVHPALLPQAGIELAHGLDHAQPGPHGPLGVIFVRLGVPEVDQEAIAEILGDMPLKAGDHLGAGLLIGPHHLAQVFRIELTGEHGRVHQVTEQHGELAAFRLRGTMFGSGGLFWQGGDVLLEGWWGSCLPHPDEHGALLVNGETLGGDELGFQVLKHIIVQIELAFERTDRSRDLAGAGEQ